MAYFTGKGGSLAVDSVAVGRVSSWSFSSTTDVTDVSKIGDCDRSYEPTARASQGTANVWYTDEADGAQSLLSKIIRTDSAHVSPRVLFSLKYGLNGEKQIRFYGYITSANLACSFGEVMQAQVGFQVDGPLLTATL